MNTFQEIHNQIFDLDEKISEVLKLVENGSEDWFVLKDVARKLNLIENEYFEQFYNKMEDEEIDSMYLRFYKELFEGEWK